MDKKDILIMYFKPFGCRKYNNGKEVATSLVDKLGCEKKDLQVFFLCLRNKDKITEYILEKQPKTILAFGEAVFQSETYLLERYDDSNEFMGNYALRARQVNIKKRKHNIKSPCFDTRDLLCNLSKIYGFKWEFIHIKKYLFDSRKNFDINKRHKDTISQLIAMINKI